MLKLIIAKTPNFLTKCVLWRRTAKLEAYGGRLLVPPGTLMSASVKQRVWGGGGGGWGKSPYLLIFSFFKQPQFWSFPWRVLPFTWYIGIWHVTSRVKHLLCKYNFQRILWLLTESKQSKWLFPGLLHIIILFHPMVPDHLEILFQWHKWNCTFLAGKTTDFVNSEVNCAT